MNSTDPYGRNIFAHDPHRDGPGARRPRSQAVHVEIGMVLEDVASGWVGAVTRVEKSGGIHLVELEDRRGVRRSFPLGPGFWLEGRPIEALPPSPAPAQASSSTQVSASGRRITNSGSFAPASSGPKVAKRSRIWVEGRHDAELVQHVWGEDLAEAGIAVQLLEGVDNLEAILEVFGPTDTARAGILVDHMVPGSKESRIAEAVSARWPGAVLVLGHPFVDIWQAFKPARVGLVSRAASISSMEPSRPSAGRMPISVTSPWGGSGSCPLCVPTATLNPRCSAVLRNLSTLSPCPGRSRTTALPCEVRAGRTPGEALMSPPIGCEE